MADNTQQPSTAPVHFGDPKAGANTTDRFDPANPRYAAIAAMLGSGLYLAGSSLAGRKGRKGNRLLKALLYGAGTGAATLAGLYGWQYLRGTDYSHQYDVEKALAGKAGTKPRVQIVMTGANGGPIYNSDVNAANDRYGEGNYIMFNPFDKKYQKEILQRIHKAAPDAEISVDGHSWGARAAMDLSRTAEGLGIPINTMRTFDGAWRFMDTSKPKNVKQWDNYYSSTLNPRFFGDFWALVGGHREELPGANNTRVTDPTYSNHSDIKRVPASGDREGYAGIEKRTTNRADDPKEWMWPFNR